MTGRTSSWVERLDAAAAYRAGLFVVMILLSSMSAGCMAGLGAFPTGQSSTVEAGSVRIVNATHSNVTAASAVVAWNVTQDGLVAWVDYGRAGREVQNSTNVSHGAGLHEVVLWDLQSNASYWYAVKVGARPGESVATITGSLKTLHQAPRLLGFRLTSVAWDTAAFAWDVASDGEPVASLEMAPAGSEEWTTKPTVHGTAGGQATVQGLAPNTTYRARLRVTLEGSVGDALSEPMNITTLQKPLLADIVLVHSVNFTTARVEWVVDGPTGFEGGLEFKGAGDGWRSVATTNASVPRVAVVSPLEAASTYLVRAWVQGADGAVVRSANVSISTRQAPVVVRDLEVESGGDGTASFAWRVEGDESAMTQVEIVSAGGVRRYGDVWTGPGEVTDSLGRLEPGVEYQVRVKASAAGGFHYWTPFEHFQA